jgi:RNA polymerase sigma factor for flagellar operon FliA
MAADNLALFQKYKQTGDVEIRNEIVLIYMNIVKYAAMSLRNVYAKYGDHDDIINEGVIALINAVETFNLERGVKFETYANLKIKGAIIDYVRKQDWVPRQVRRFGKELDEMYNKLYNEIGRAPTNNEIAEAMGLSREKFAKNMADAASTMTLSFEELLYEDNFTDRSLLGNEADRGLYDKELRRIITEAINALNPKEKQVISLHYYEKLKFVEIARVIGVTESRVCQIHSKSMLHLKRRLEEYIKM